MKFVDLVRWVHGQGTKSTRCFFQMCIASRIIEGGLYLSAPDTCEERLVTAVSIYTQGISSDYE